MTTTVTTALAPVTEETTVLVTNEIVSIKDITTNKELRRYLNDPKLDGFFPTEHEARHLLSRVSSKDTSKTKLNWARSLDHIQTTRAACRNHGSFGMEFSNAAATEGLPVVLLGLPTPETLYKKVWSLLPDQVRAKVTEWAKKKMDGPIAFEIRDFVKKALQFLPIPIPHFLLNSVVNLAIPPLVQFIMKFLNPNSVSEQTLSLLRDTPIFVHHTSQSLDLMRNYDRKILLASGLPAHELPPHLNPLPPPENPPLPPVVPSQPDDRDCRTNMGQFYQGDTPNGHKSLDLAEFVSAQIRTNKASDEAPEIFGAAVWASLDPDTKTKLETAAKASPPDRENMGDILYTPTRNRLEKGPYYVPGAIVDTFTTMKAPEAIEWIVANFKQT